MQIKSWQIAAIGTFFQFIIIIWLILPSILYSTPQDEGDAGAGARLSYLIGPPISAIIFGVISTLLLYFNKTKKFGAIISILSFFVLFYIFLDLEWSLSSLIELFILIGILGISLLISGIHYFWKKV